MKKYILVGLVVIAVISLSGCSADSNRAASPAPSPVPTMAASPTSQNMMESNVAYKDGKYEVEGEYVSPGGPEKIQVTVTLKDNVIAEAEVVAKAELPMSVQFQKTFIENYKPMVIGKNINEVNLTKVSGSSLTPKGFNDALNKIKVEAQG